MIVKKTFGLALYTKQKHKKAKKKKKKKNTKNKEEGKSLVSQLLLRSSRRILCYFVGSLTLEITLLFNNYFILLTLEC
jgi:hypothetical protein